MRHHHTAAPQKLCPGCIPEAVQITEEKRRARFWGIVIVVSALAFAAVTAFVLFKLGRMGR